MPRSRPRSVAALQEYWRAQFPAAFGRPWRDISRFVPVHTGDRRVPCVRVGRRRRGPGLLLPVGRRGGVGRGRAHPRGPARRRARRACWWCWPTRWGTPCRARLGLDELQARQPSRYPTILLEAMADCYAGVALAHFAQKPPPGLALGADERDRAMSALIAFKDPLGVEPGDAGAPRQRVRPRVGVPGRLRRRRHHVRGDDDHQPRLHPAGVRLAARTRPAAATSRSTICSPASAPTLRRRSPGSRRPRACPGGGRLRCAPPQAGARSPRRARRRGARTDNTVVVDRAAVAPAGGPVRRFRGRHAHRQPLRPRRARAGVAQQRPPAPRRSAWRAPTPAACSKADGTFTLSPGDLDEAVEVLLAQDWAGRDAAGAADPERARLRAHRALPQGRGRRLAGLPRVTAHRVRGHAGRTA